MEISQWNLFVWLIYAHKMMVAMSLDQVEYKMPLEV
jgi:hypothetical protein